MTDMEHLQSHIGEKDSNSDPKRAEYIDDFIAIFTERLNELQPGMYIDGFVAEIFEEIKNEIQVNGLSIHTEFVEPGLTTVFLIDNLDNEDGCIKYAWDVFSTVTVEINELISWEWQDILRVYRYCESAGYSVASRCYAWEYKFFIIVNTIQLGIFFFVQVILFFIGKLSGDSPYSDQE